MVVMKWITAVTRERLHRLCWLSITGRCAAWQFGSLAVWQNTCCLISVPLVDCCYKQLHWILDFDHIRPSPRNTELHVLLPWKVGPSDLWQILVAYIQPHMAWQQCRHCREWKIWQDGDAQLGDTVDCQYSINSHGCFVAVNTAAAIVSTSLQQPT
jgi:hypothetical protein